MKLKYELLQDATFHLLDGKDATKDCEISFKKGESFEGHLKNFIPRFSVFQDIEISDGKTIMFIPRTSVKVSISWEDAIDLIMGANAVLIKESNVYKCPNVVFQLDVGRFYVSYVPTGTVSVTCNYFYRKSNEWVGIETVNSFEHLCFRTSSNAIELLMVLECKKLTEGAFA
jgi:hypothetical protein